MAISALGAPLDRPHPRGESLAFALVVAAAVALYLPSLRFGYFYDDFWLLQQGAFDAHRLVLARPLWHLPSWLLAQVSVDPGFQRALNLACFALVAVIGARLLRGAPLGWLVLAVLLAHPWFVYPVTWISQRSDLIWLALVGLALAATSARASAGWTLLSLLAKAPFILHAPVLGWRLLRAGHPGLAAMVAGATAFAAALCAWFVLGPEVLDATAAEGGLHTLKRTIGDPGALVGVFLFAGAAKIGESLAMIFVPFPALYGTAAGIAALCAYLIAWAIVIRELVRTGGRGLNGWWIAVGLAAASAFFFLAQLRAIAPAGFFLLAGLLVGLPATRASRLALGLLLAANLAGVAALYRATDTGCFDLTEPGAVARCQEPPELPAVRWQRERSELVQAIAARIRERP